MMKWASYVFRSMFIFLMMSVLIYFLVGCTPQPCQVETTTTTLPGLMIPLSWEKDHPERKEWSDFVIQKLSGPMFNTFDVAKDAKRFCPNYDSLSKNKRVNMWAEMISAVALTESNWNPKSASVDVGNKDQKDTWSIGLMQISVVDQKNMNVDLGYNYDQLLTAKPNLDLALKIMERQIQKTGLVILPNSNPNRYWATILDGNKYNQIPGITAMTKKVCQ